MGDITNHIEAVDLDALAQQLAIFDDDVDTVATLGAVDRARALRRVYAKGLVKPWSEWVKALQLLIETLETSTKKQLSELAAHRDTQIAAAAAKLKLESDSAESLVTLAKRELESASSSLNSAISTAHGKIGSPLGIEAPNSSKPPKSLPPLATPSSNLRQAVEDAASLPTVEPFLNEKAIRALRWAAPVAAVLGWIVMRDFSGGLFFAGGTVALVAGHRAYVRSTYRVTFDELVTAAQEEITYRACALRDARTVYDDKTRRYRETMGAEIAAANAQFKAAEAQTLAESERMRLVLRDRWEKALEHVEPRLTHFAEAVAELTEKNPAAVGNLENSTGGEVQAPPVSARLGTIAAEGLLDLLMPNDEMGEGFDLVPEIDVGLPVFWNFADKQSLLLLDEAPAEAGASDILGAIMSRLLLAIPPGKVRFTLFDPAGLGKNFGAFLHLKDFAQDLISGQVWSSREHMRARLADLLAHIETVTQTYLRSDYPDIDSYNRHAETIAEPYRFLVISDFPDGFDAELFKDLAKVVQNGPRCGVFCVIHGRAAVSPPHGVTLDALKPFALVLTRAQSETWTIVVSATSNLDGVTLDRAPSADKLKAIVINHGSDSLQAMRVEVAYADLVKRAKLDQEPLWSRSSADGIQVPLGPLGAKGTRSIVLGKGLAHHALIVGRPGSGKSNLLHVLINAATRLYSPDELQLYLIDFKQGVEFKPYADHELPHARVIAVESEREFGASVLQGLNAEMQRRGELFRSNKCSSLSEYRKKTKATLPRLLLIVDEFQEFFTHDDKLKEEARSLIDRLVRQGRSYGIHLVLGTQTLANAGLPASTRDQMAVRIALQCSDADSRLILAEDNPKARLLTRPGEAIYNDKAGLVEGNDQFQIAIFSEEDRTTELDRLIAHASETGWAGQAPLVFEGHEPAPISRSSVLVNRGQDAKSDRINLWLGESVSMDPPVAAVLKASPGRNLLIISRDEEQAIGVGQAALLSAALQMNARKCSFEILDYTTADSDWADVPEHFSEAADHLVSVGGKRELKATIERLETEVRSRLDGGSSKGKPRILLAILGLHRVRELRQEPEGGAVSRFMGSDGPSLNDQIAYILREGPEVGIHAIVWADSVAAVVRAFDRSALDLFGLRVAGAVPRDDSHRLFDSEIAARIDKPYRMAFFDDDQIGVLKLLRPYAWAKDSVVLEKLEPADAAKKPKVAAHA